MSTLANTTLVASPVALICCQLETQQYLKLSPTPTMLPTANSATQADPFHMGGQYLN